MNTVLIDAIGWTVLGFLWQGALIGAGAALVLLALRTAHPRYRYATASAALLACLAWPLADLGLRADAAWSDGGAAQVIRSDRPAAGQGAEADVLAAVVAEAVSAATAALPYVVLLWLAGVALLGLRTGAGLAWIARSADGAAAPEWERRAAQLGERMGIGRTPRVRLAPGLDSPVAAGWRDPLFLLPAPLAAGMPPAQLDALLAHELAHIRRRDYAVNLLQNLIVILVFFHPVAWWLARRIHAERELLADELAARTLGEPRALAAALAELDRQRHAGLHLAQAASGGELLTRIRALVKPQAAALKLRIVLPAVALSLAGVTLAANSAGKATGQALTRNAIVDFSTCAKPHYPAESLAAEHTGTVTLKFIVDRSGAVVRSKLMRSSGHPALDQAAQAGISKCRFKPAQRNGLPVKSSLQMQYVWQLQ